VSTMWQWSLHDSQYYRMAQEPVVTVRQSAHQYFIQSRVPAGKFRAPSWKDRGKSTVVNSFYTAFVMLQWVCVWRFHLLS